MKRVLAESSLGVAYVGGEGCRFCEREETAGLLDCLRTTEGKIAKSNHLAAVHSLKSRRGWGVVALKVKKSKCLP